MVLALYFTDPRNEPSVPPTSTATSRGISSSSSIALYCNRATRPDRELSQMKIAPQAAACFSVPRPSMMIRGTR